MDFFFTRVVVTCIALTMWPALDTVSCEAGTTGFLSGSVVDEVTGLGIADERVTVEAPSAKTTVRTDAKGRYSILSLPPDVYVVIARRDGYETTAQNNVSVTSDQTIVVNLRTVKR